MNGEPNTDPPINADDSHTLQGNDPEDLRSGFDYVQGATPSNPSEGEEWYADGSGTKSKGAYVYDGANWIEESISDHAKLNNINPGDHHSRYTDSEAQTAVNNDADHGSTAPHNYRTNSEIEENAILWSEGFAPGFGG